MLSRTRAYTSGFLVSVYVWKALYYHGKYLILAQTCMPINSRKYIVIFEYLTSYPIAAKHFWIPDIFIDRSKVIRDPAFYVKLHP